MQAGLHKKTEKGDGYCGMEGSAERIGGVLGRKSQARRPPGPEGIPVPRNPESCPDSNNGRELLQIHGLTERSGLRVLILYYEGLRGP